MNMEEDRSNSEDFDDDYEYDFIPMTPAFEITSAILLAVLIIFAISGNTITILAYITDKRLHTVYDFFIFNLAVTDLLIGCISMPFYAIYTIREFVWDFGDTFCKVWNVIDFTLCLESILLILTLSFDRLCLVKYGPFYSSKVTKFKARLIVFISWITSFMLYGPAIIGWNYWVGYTTVEPLDCDVEFAYNFAFTTTTGIFEFVIPVCGLAILNIIIYQHIRSRVGHENKTKNNLVHSSTVPRDNSNVVREVAVQETLPQTVKNRKTQRLDFSSSRDQNDKTNHCSIEYGVNETFTKTDYLHSITSKAQEEKDSKDSDYKLNLQSSQEKHKEERIFVNANGGRDKIYTNDQTRGIAIAAISKQENKYENETSHINQVGADNFKRKLNDINRSTGNSTHYLDDMLTVDRTNNRIKFANIPERWSVFNISVTFKKRTSRKSRNRYEHSRIKRESKAARFLAILVIVFLACWAPYTLTTIIVSFCGDKCVNTSAYECMNWLLWSKSAINPLLYAMNSSRYRYNFKKYMLCWKNQVHPGNTETTYQTAV
ncbi:histamine H4 receptor-like [Mercenaria mercenaria]|uniref:histamine H4 receptor-like n=1 Tax=Mercenaria mercenaria TaxID=6596 RepID=UPI00234F50CF|nr:histamine H4 receptor-like [Mercenaria mercenaria]